jgi:hypothetical protein
MNLGLRPYSLPTSMSVSEQFYSIPKLVIRRKEGLLNPLTVESL